MLLRIMVDYTQVTYQILQICPVEDDPPQLQPNTPWTCAEFFLPKTIELHPLFEHPSHGRHGTAPRVPNVSDEVREPHSPGLDAVEPSCHRKQASMQMVSTMWPDSSRPRAN